LPAEHRLSRRHLRQPNDHSPARLVNHFLRKRHVSCHFTLMNSRNRWWRRPFPRRESLRLLGAAVAGALLGPLGMDSAFGAGRDPCKTFCNQCPRPQRALCLAACRACNGNSNRLSGASRGCVCGAAPAATTIRAANAPYACRLPIRAGRLASAASSEDIRSADQCVNETRPECDAHPPRPSGFPDNNALETRHLKSSGSVPRTTNAPHVRALPNECRRRRPGRDRRIRR
jgi:hypothetical protein